MKMITGRVMAGLCALATMSLAASSAGAQSSEMKEKPPLYTYVSNWTIPRARWAEMAKDTSNTNKVLEQDLGSGNIVGYGDDTTLVHTLEGSTHDNWWSATSVAALFNVLDEFYKNGAAVSPVLESATRHSDQVFVSHFYNWRAGAYKGAYTHAAVYKLKADAPDDAVGMLSKTIIEPLLEKLLAQGAVIEYEIDEEEVHTDSSDRFWVVWISPNSQGLDKADAAVSETMKANPLAVPTIEAMVDFGPHRDWVYRSNVTYK